MFEVGQRVKVTRIIGSDETFAELAQFVGREGVVTEVVIPNSDPEVYRVILSGIVRTILWLGFDELEAMDDV